MNLKERLTVKGNCKNKVVTNKSATYFYHLLAVKPLQLLIEQSCVRPEELPLLLVVQCVYTTSTASKQETRSKVLL